MTRNLFILLACCLVIASCKSPDARRPVQSTSGSFINKSAERNKELFEKEKTQIAGIIEADTKNNYITSNSGFWYYYNRQDTLQTNKPILGDRITFSYEVNHLNGSEILSENEIGLQEYIVDQSNQDLISGLRDGIKLMKMGETITFLFPSYKAYGYYGIANKLGANVPIQCTVTLKNINQTNENY